MAIPTLGAMIAAMGSPAEWGAVSTTKLYWDDANGRLGIGTTTPETRLSVMTGAAGLLAKFGDSAKVNCTYFYDYWASPDSPSIIFGDGSGWKFHIGKASDSGATKFITIVDTGKVGIGTTAPVSGLSIRGAGYAQASFVTYGAGTGNTTYSLICRNSDLTDRIWVRDDGGCYATTPAWNSSGRSVKENFVDISEGVEIVKKLKPLKFDYKDGPKNHIGFVAEDVALGIPEAVMDSPLTPGELLFNPSFIQPYLVLAIQELNIRLEELEKPK